MAPWWTSAPSPPRPGRERCGQRRGPLLRRRGRPRRRSGPGAGRAIPEIGFVPAFAASKPLTRSLHSMRVLLLLLRRRRRPPLVLITSSGAARGPSVPWRCSGLWRRGGGGSNFFPHFWRISSPEYCNCRVKGEVGQGSGGRGGAVRARSSGLRTPTTACAPTVRDSGLRRQQVFPGSGLRRRRRHPGSVCGEAQRGRGPPAPTGSGVPGNYPGWRCRQGTVLFYRFLLLRASVFFVVTTKVLLSKRDLFDRITDAMLPTSHRRR